MISFIALGNHGKLGNQMFQVAATLSAANRLGTQAHFPRGSQIERVFDLKDCKFTDEIKPSFAYYERSFEFDDSFFSLPDSCNLHGYFQSEKYFKNCESLIQENFNFKHEIKKLAEQNMQDIKSHVCALHVRRGDYLTLSDVHQFPGIDYYSKAMSMIRSNFENVSFLIFSDDITWCSSVDAFRDCKFVVSDSDAVEMCMMSMCDFHIIANSSFSWWGSKLSKSLLTIAPATWFGPAGPKIWRDVYCRNWKTM